MTLKRIVHDAIQTLPAGHLLQEIADQALHVAWGYGIVILTLVVVRYSNGDPRKFRVAMLCMLLPVLVLLPRELVDQWPIENLADTMLDLIMCGVGGLLAWLHVK